MTNADRLVELFSEAKIKPAGFEREQFLNEACRDDPDLREQVDSLLSAENGAGDFLQLSCDANGVTDETPDVIGRYKLREIIGEGGCGVVYVADQEEPVRRRVALKLIKLGMDTRAVVARFEGERQALAMMDHPNIAKVLDAGATEAGRPYFVMELVRGTRITDYCNRNDLATNQRLALFIQVCQAVQHAHQKGIIHRDLKPSNVLVTLHDGVPVPKIIDFGIAKAIEGRLTDWTVYTRLHHFVGTPAYMSPEQAEMSGLDIDTRSDIYSLGVLLYELLTGSTPFDEHELLSKGLEGMRRTIRETDPLRPSTKLAMTRRAAPRNLGQSKCQIPDSRIEKDLDWIVMKCLEKDRTRRYETANGLAADLRRYLQDEPVTARPPSTAYRLRKAIRRNKVAFATAALVAIALLLGLVVSLWQRAAAQRQIYVGRINLARQAWEENHVRRVRELVALTAAELDRGFEWYYWQRQTHLELATLRGHSGPVSAVAFSPDGTRILTGSFDGRAMIWDATLGSRPFITITGRVDRIQSVAWSPDGLSVALAGNNGQCEVWHATTNRLQFSIMGHQKALTSVAFSPNGQRLLTASRDGTARVWDVTDGRPLECLEHSSPVWTAAFSADAKRVLVATGNEEAIVWDLSAGAQACRLKAPRSQHPMRELDKTLSQSPFTALFSLDERWIITGSQDQTIRFWDAVTGTKLPMELEGSNYRLSPRESDIPFAVALSPEGERLITGGFDQSAALWSIAARQRRFLFKGHEAELGAVAFSPDGKRVVTGSFDCTAKVWDAIANKEHRLFEEHKMVVTSAAFSRDSRRVVTSSWDKTAKVWDVATGSVLLNLHHPDRVSVAAFSHDDDRIVTGCDDGAVRVFDAITGEVIDHFSAHGTNVVNGAAFSRAGDRILTAGVDGFARLWDASNGRELLRKKHQYPRVIAAFSPDSRFFVTASHDGDPWTTRDCPVFVWDSYTGRELRRLPGHHGEIGCIAVSPDGRRIITGSVDRTAKVWDIATRRCLATLTGHRSTVIGVAFTPDGRRIITTGFDYTTRLWDSATFQELLNLKDYLFLAISPDGQRMVNGGAQFPRVLEIASKSQSEKWNREEVGSVPSGRP